MQQQLITFTMEEFQKQFQIDLKPVGRGHDASVFKVLHNQTNQQFALKVLTQSSPDHLCNIYNEINILIQIKNIDFVTHIIGHSVDYTCILLEYMPYGSFFYLLQMKPFPISLAKRQFYQLCQTTLQLHEQGIVHGDIKPENMLISNDFQVKLCDFGFSKSINLKPTKNSIGGSVGYIAPEVYYNQKIDFTICDIFSLGCPPFQNNHPNVKDEWWNLIQNKKWELYWEMFQVKDEGFKNIIENLLTTTQENRLKLKQILQNEWLNDNIASDEDLQQEIKMRVSKK